MRESPILFNAPMVRAILDDRKTVTRRVVDPQPPHGHSFVGWCTTSTCRADEGKAVWSGGDQRVRLTAPHRVRCPYGMPGDRLWVRETFMRVPHPSEVGLTRADMPRTWEAACATAGSHLYRADDCSDIFADGRRWTPSIHMPRAASRITLEVTGVRVERLQDISEEDAIAEGLHRIEIGSGYPDTFSAAAATWAQVIEQEVDAYDDPRQAYRDLWEQINGAGSWDANPWVWAVEFRRIEQEALAHG